MLRIGVLTASLAAMLLIEAFGPTPVSAQEPSRAELAAARRHFRQGMRAGQREDWEAAREAFERAYQIVPRPRVLLNLGSAQMQTGRLVEASRSYQTFLARVTSGPDMQYREGVEVELARLEERIPRLRIEAAGLLDSDELRVDDQVLTRRALGVELPLNPGAHVVVVHRGGAEVAREEISLEEGQLHEVSLDTQVSLPSPTLPDEAGDDLLADEGSTGVLGKWWFWTAIGGAVVAGVLIAVIVASSGGEPQRQAGNFGDGRLVIE